MPTKGRDWTDAPIREYLSEGSSEEMDSDMSEGLQMDLMRLNEVVDHFHDIVRHYTNKLEPVLTPEGAMISADTITAEKLGAKAPLSPVRERIAEMTRTLNGQQRAFEALLKKVEL